MPSSKPVKILELMGTESSSSLYFQSSALPTELPGREMRKRVLNSCARSESSPNRRFRAPGAIIRGSGRRGFVGGDAKFIGGDVEAGVRGGGRDSETHNPLVGGSPSGPPPFSISYPENRPGTRGLLVHRSLGGRVGRRTKWRWGWGQRGKFEKADAQISSLGSATHLGLSRPRQIDSVVAFFSVTLTRWMKFSNLCWTGTDHLL